MTQNCLKIQSDVDSRGIWSSDRWLAHSLPVLELQMLLLFSSFAFIHHALKRFWVSKVSCQIIAGLILGYILKQWKGKTLKLFTVNSEEILALMAFFSYALYLFLCTVKADLISTIRDRRALKIGIVALMVTPISYVTLRTFIRHGFPRSSVLPLKIFITLHSMTSFPVISSLMDELNLAGSSLGRLGLSSALVSDLLFFSFILLSNMPSEFQARPKVASMEVGGLILFLVAVIFGFRPAMVRIAKQGQPVKGCYVQFVIFLVLGSVIFSTLIGQSPLFGPYILGLAMPNGDALGLTVVNKVEFFVDIWFPILVATSMFRADVSMVFAAFETHFTRFNVMVVLLVSLVKVASCFLCSLYCKLPVNESLALTLIMCCKGVIDVVYVTQVSDGKIITDDGLLAIFFLAIAVIATIVPLGVKRLCCSSKETMGHEIRNITLLNPNSELRLLTCIHTDENIHGIQHLLNLSCPTLENPVSAFVCHLVEHTDPANPSHKLKNMELTDNSYSKHIVRFFQHFEKDNNGTIQIECFTSISSQKFMQTNICSLAGDKNTSLIILPFHRTWKSGGVIDRDDDGIRAMNHSMLEKAPCSVGIFANRGFLATEKATTPPLRKTACKYSVCVVYLGGNDDREAITYAKRMAKDSRVKLTVLRIRSLKDDDEGEEGSWEKILDSGVLKDFKSNCLGDGNVRYVEEVSLDGQQTARTLGHFVKDYDLMIVGRRQGLESPQINGLNEWCEFSELGIVGDLIVSTDVENPASVLVIQQQLIR